MAFFIATFFRTRHRMHGHEVNALWDMSVHGMSKFIFRTGHIGHHLPRLKQMGYFHKKFTICLWRQGKHDHVCAGDNRFYRCESL